MTKKIGIKNLNVRKTLTTLALTTGIALTTTSCGNNNTWGSNYTYHYAVDVNDDNAIIYDVAEWSDPKGVQLQILTGDNDKEGLLGSLSNIRLYNYEDPELVEAIAQTLVGEDGTVTWYDDIKENKENILTK